jgi:hypothetical protein
MHVGRKRALLLLIVVVLWTAAPALACFPPSAQPACCQGVMQGCDDAPAMDGMACCQVHPSESNVPPATAAPFDLLLSTTQASAWAVDLPDRALHAGQILPTAISPSPPSELSSILRI